MTEILAQHSSSTYKPQKHGPKLSYFGFPSPSIECNSIDDEPEPFEGAEKGQFMPAGLWTDEIRTPTLSVHPGDDRPELAMFTTENDASREVHIHSPRSIGQPAVSPVNLTRLGNNSSGHTNGSRFYQRAQHVLEDWKQLPRPEEIVNSLPKRLSGQDLPPIIHENSKSPGQKLEGLKMASIQSPANSRHFSEVDIVRFEAFQREAEQLMLQKAMAERNQTNLGNSIAEYPKTPEIDEPRPKSGIFHDRRRSDMVLSKYGLSRGSLLKLDESCAGFATSRTFGQGEAKNKLVWREILSCVDRLVSRSFAWPSKLEDQDRYNLMSVIDSAATRRKSDLLIGYVSVLSGLKNAIPTEDSPTVDRLASLTQQLDHSVNSTSETNKTSIKNSAYEHLIGKSVRETLLVESSPSQQQADVLVQSGKTTKFVDKKTGRLFYLSQKEVSDIKSYYRDAVNRSPEPYRRYICSFEEYMDALLQDVVHPCESLNQVDKVNSQVYLRALCAYNAQKNLHIS